MTRKNALFFFLGIFFFLSFLVFSYIVHEDYVTRFDFNTTVKLQDNLSRQVIPFFSFFSIAGNFEVLTVVLLLLLFLLRKLIAGIVLFSSFVLFHIVELFGKIYVDHPPPPQFMLLTEHPFEFPQFHVRTESSYPSGHSGRTVFLSVILLYLLWNSKRIPRILKIVLSLGIVTFVGIMLVSRPYLGEHWVSDVIGGTFLALGLSLLGLGFVFSKSTLHYLNRILQKVR